MSSTSFLAIGHRGARGVYPENSLPAFEYAVASGVDETELDVVISMDGHVVVSHEAWMNPSVCSRPDGKPVEQNSREKYNLYTMSYEEIRSFDCGLRGHPDFPQQKKIPVYKPLLSETFQRGDDYAQRHSYPLPRYLVEIKSGEDPDGIFNPPPEEFAGLVYAVLEKNNVLSRTRLQSFDPRILNALKKNGALLPLALLVENTNSFEANLALLDFAPDCYSPDYTFVTTELVEKTHRMNMQLIPWTVNETIDMRRLLAMGVDGLISDYPERLLQLK